MTDQILIKLILIAVFLGFGFMLVRPSRGARNQAIRILGLLIFVGAAVYAVLFPALVNKLAELVGVGRGTDLLLYVFILVFIAQTFSATRKTRSQNAEITVLARKIALMEPRLRNLPGCDSQP